VGIHEISHKKGESSQEKCEIKAKKSEWLAGVQGVQVQGRVKVDKEIRPPYPVLSRHQGGAHLCYQKLNAGGYRS
jgi:hypothetical protein